MRGGASGGKRAREEVPETMNECDLRSREKREKLREEEKRQGAKNASAERGLCEYSEKERKIYYPGE